MLSGLFAYVRSLRYTCRYMVVKRSRGRSPCLSYRSVDGVSNAGPGNVYGSVLGSRSPALGCGRDAAGSGLTSRFCMGWSTSSISGNASFMISTKVS